jgi:hypothetical protein
MTSKFETREQWLEAAVVHISRLFKDINIELPPVRVSVGWPSKGGLASKVKVIGQCWSSKAAKDGISQVFISPTLGDDLVQSLAVLVHELVHAWDDCKHQHKGPFAEVAKRVGLVGKMTQSNAGPELEIKLKAIISDLGEFPHSPLVASEVEKEIKKQTTRMIKLVTPDCCEYTVRTTQKWIDEGLPSCPHGVTMEIA